jgi:tRNA G37 N-methylase TrmD
MKIDVLTLFPAMFAGPLDESIIKRARDSRFAGFENPQSARLDA